MAARWRAPETATAAPRTSIATIQAIGAQGDGVTADGVFVPLTLPGERVVARVAGGRAELAEVLSPSPDRVSAPCPHFGDCGGCALQHWASEPYLAWKNEQIRLALARMRIETDISTLFAAAPGSRRRVALHARRQDRRVLLGFKARRSWRLAAIDTCVIAEPRLAAALPALRRLAEPFLEHPKSAPILHVTATDTGLDVDVTGVERRGGGLSADGRMRAAQVAAGEDMARVTLAGEIIYQARPAVVRLGTVGVTLPPGAFLQAVAAAEEAMARVMVEAAAGARGIADLFCGVGAFTLRLAAAAPVLAADSSAPAIDALRAAMGGSSGLHAVNAQARDLDRRPMLVSELTKIDVAVFDPPRAGASGQSAQLAASTVSRVIAVSCNPATFARDAKALTDGGFGLDRVLSVDQFLWSPHIELMGVFSRAGR